MRREFGESDDMFLLRVAELQRLRQSDRREWKKDFFKRHAAPRRLRLVDPGPCGKPATDGRAK